jgi:hypothetical protein
MEAFTVILVISTAFIVFAINESIFRFIVDNAKQKHIRPYLNNLGFEIDKFELVGLFGSGDFTTNESSHMPYMPYGNPMQTVYVYAYIRKVNEIQTIRITAKVMTFFLFIRKVEYSKVFYFTCYNIDIILSFFETLVS